MDDNQITKRRPSEEKPWKKYFPEGVTEMEVPKLSAYRFLLQSNKDNMGGPALNYMGKLFTYRELADRIEKYATCFKAIGVKKGDLVSFVSLAIPECVASIYALNKLGATCNMIDPRMDSNSIKRMVLASESKVLIVLDAVFDKVAPVLDDLKQDHVLVHRVPDSLPAHLKLVVKIKMRPDIPFGTKNIVNWKDFVSKNSGPAVEDAPVDEEGVVAITYTGGTTGKPKGVMITNRSMNAVAMNFQNWGLEYHAGQRFLGIIPVFASYGMVCGLHMPLCMNQMLIPIPRFNPMEFGKLVKKYRPNHMISTPAFYEMMMDSEEVKGLDMSFVVTLGSGGDTMNEGLEGKLDEFMVEHNIRYPLAQGYGMSELSAAATFGVNDIHRSGSVGIPSPNTIVGIFDPDTKEELGYNEIGEVCVTGPSMMKGYWNQPEETANVMRKHDDGRTWIHSGDLGLIDEDGFLFIKGRIKRMITRFDGHKVFPVNLEGLINAHEAVMNCSVVGVRDRAHGQGQLPIALAEIHEGYDAQAVCKELLDICNREAEERGRPVAVIPIDEIPLTGMGKNDYRKLEDLYRDYDYTA